MYRVSQQVLDSNAGGLAVGAEGSVNSMVFLIKQIREIKIFKFFGQKIRQIEGRSALLNKDVNKL